MLSTDEIIGALVILTVWIFIPVFVCYSCVLGYLQNDLKLCKYMVGHNIDNFDVKELRKYSEGYAIELSIPSTIDTMKVSKEYVNARNKKGGLKIPRLEELYKRLYSSDINTCKQHTADYDVKITAKYFKKLIEIGIVKL